MSLVRTRGMTLRQRAIQAEEKRERSDAILDAAERLIGAAPDHLASMAEVADEAGVAKGTVYLYFRSKEELYLALHERNIASFFDAVTAQAARAEALTIDDMLAPIRRHIVESRIFLPLATRCFGVMAESMPRDVGHAFTERIAARLAGAGAGLERQFPQLGPGGGVALLRHSYALILGLWHMSTGTCPASNEPRPPHDDRRYADELDRALRALWRGTLGMGGEGDAAR